MTNVRSGGKTPIAGIIHALTLFLIIAIAAPLAKNIPLATLGAILLFVAYNMGEWHEFIRLKHFMRSYQLILISTFILTVVVDLTVAVEVGLGLSFLFFVRHMSSLTRLEPIPEVEVADHARLGGDIEAYRLCGTLFFGSVQRLEELMDPMRKVPKILVLSISSLLNMDASGLEALESLHKTLEKRGCRLLISGANGQPESIMKRTGFAAHIGAANIFDTTIKALEYASHSLGHAVVVSPAAD